MGKEELGERRARGRAGCGVQRVGERKVLSAACDSAGVLHRCAVRAACEWEGAKSDLRS